MRRFDDAERDFSQTILLAPQIAYGYIGKAHVLLARDGDVDGAKQIMLEMSRRANAADIAEAFVTGISFDFAQLRVFPETYTEVFDAFESGPVERFRRTQPAAIAMTHLARAMVYEAMDDRRSASARCDSAGVYYERIIGSNPQSAYICLYHAALGHAYAGLGRKEDAIREGEEAVRMLPISRDALVGGALVELLAEIYVMCGEYDAAIDKIEAALSVPSTLSSGLLRADPIWNPVRTNPRFRRLVERN